VISDLGAGGAQRVLSLLANAWVKRGHAVTVITFEHADAQAFFPLADGIAVKRLALRADAASAAHGVALNLGRLRAVRRAIRVEAPDIVVSFLDQVNVIVLLATIGLGVPVLACERTDPFVAPLSRLWSLARRATYRRARAVVVQTAAIARFFEPWLRGRVVVIPNPVPPVAASERAGGGTGLRKTVLSVGRLSEEKRFDLLIAAFGRVAGRFPEWTLVIAGEGPMGPELARLRDDLGLKERVILPGLQREIGPMYRDADVFALSSRFEGFPNALCEAVAHGLPAVATDCASSVSDLVLDGRNGFVVANGSEEALADALGRLMGDPDLRQRFGRETAAVGERFSLERVLASWDAAFGRCRLRVPSP
jgi:glycosyltransferase involved in cell wall biosynthesis